jgi:glycosyltransferase involved in cell wall biosynthesis
VASINRESIRLTVVTPVARMAGRLQNLNSWISTMDDPSVEIILIHDIQDEKTGVELQHLVRQLNDSRIVMIEGIFGAPGLARNAGLAIAKGEWVCFWDSDDVPQTRKFFQMVELANAENSECAVGEFTAVHDLSLKTKRHTLTDDYLNEIAIHPGIWRFAFKREALDGLKFSSLRMAEDQLFIAEFGIATRRLLVFPHSVYQYFLGEDFHLTRSKSARRDLPEAVDRSFSLAKAQNESDFRFTSILLCRQAITTLRVGDSKLRLQVVKVIILGFCDAGGSFRRDIVKRLWFILRNREPVL